jgi:hypothetical protein
LDTESDNEEYEIVLRGPSGELMDATVTLVDEESETETARLELRFGETHLSAVATDFFDAFAQVRRELWERKILPLCYGASRNVFPSPMSRDMGGGGMAYRLALGRHAMRDDLVFIFDTGPDIEPVLPQEQEEFYERWLASSKHA